MDTHDPGSDGQGREQPGRDASADGGSQAGGHEQEAAPEWAGYFGTRERYDAFESMVRRHFKQRGRTVMIVEGVVLPAGGGESQGRYGLGNLGQVCAGSAEGDWPALIERHFGMLERTEQQADALKEQLRDFEAVSPKLVVRLWDAAAISEIRAKQVVWEEMPGLCAVLALDLPESIRAVMRDEAAAWGKSEEELFATAMDNVEAMVELKTQDLDLPDGGKLTVFSGDSYYVASLALRPGRLSKALGPHGMFVSMPVRNMILAMPLGSLEDLQRLSSLMAITLGAERDGPGSVSKRVYWWHADRWTEVVYELTPEGLSVTPPQELVDELNRMASGA